MSRDIMERLNTFEVLSVDFRKLAINADQIEKYNPPPEPRKNDR